MLRLRTQLWSTMDQHYVNEKIFMKEKSLQISSLRAVIGGDGFNHH